MMPTKACAPPHDGRWAGCGAKTSMSNRLKIKTEPRVCHSAARAEATILKTAFFCGRAGLNGTAEPDDSQEGLFVANDPRTVIAEAKDAEEGLAAAAAGPAQPATKSKWYLWRKSGTALIAYLLDSEVHTFAFSVAANSILSFIPFVILLYTLALRVFHSSTKGPMVLVVNDMVNYFLPTATNTPGWLTSSLDAAAYASSRHGVQVLSLVMILISCTGIFLPLEVALNQAWGVAKSRNYLFNQSIAFGLALLMVGLGVASMFANVSVDKVLAYVLVHDSDNWFFRILNFSNDVLKYLWLAISTGAASIVFFFSVYYLLPNRKIPWRPVLRTSIITGGVWLAARFVFAAVLPHLDLKALYGPFYVSVGLLFWAYISGLIMFAGAQFSVARWGERSKE
jgi:YihY family inner membrane protein